MTALLRLYYAHPKSDYGTHHEHAVERELARSYLVVNPNRPNHQAAGKDQGMAYFVALCGGCDVLAYERFPDGTTGAGVAKEAGHFFELGRPVYEIADAGRALIPVRALTNVLDVEQTRSALRRFGPLPNGGRGKLCA